MKALGLLPPYTIEDVKQAFKSKAKSAHPDGGGSTREFVQLREAYTQAVEFMEFQSSRRNWLASAVERYAEHSKFVEELESQNFGVEIESEDWRKNSFGDFVQVTERITGLRLQGSTVDDTHIEQLISKHKLLRSLRLLDVANSRVSDTGLKMLSPLRSLVRVDLRNTLVSPAGLKGLCSQPHLESIHIGGLNIGFWKRFGLKSTNRKVNFITSANAVPDASPRTRISHVGELAMLRP